MQTLKNTTLLIHEHPILNWKKFIEKYIKLKLLPEIFLNLNLLTQLYEII